MTKGLNSGALLGRLSVIDATKGAVRVEDVFATDIEDLWSAITVPQRLARWLATVEGDLRVGGLIQTRFTTGNELPARIDVCDAPVRLLLTMSPGTPEESELEAVLTSVGEKTRLAVEKRGVPLDNVDAFGVGWQIHVEDLGRYLDGRELNEMDVRWEELRPLYRSLATKLQTSR